MTKLPFRIAVLLTLTACKRDWNCTCYPNGEPSTYSILNESKKQAERICQGRITIGLVDLGSTNNCLTSIK